MEGAAGDVRASRTSAGVQGFEDLGFKDLGFEVFGRFVGRLGNNLALELLLDLALAVFGADRARALLGRWGRMILAMIPRILTRHDRRQRF